jgi:fructose-1-phosphate kinase PfkB-like protein
MAGEGLETVARPPRLSAGHPTGAGDACLAGIVWALQQGLSPVEAARWGAATGTAAAAQTGSGVGSFQEVEKLYQQVVVDEL